MKNLLLGALIALTAVFLISFRAESTANAVTERISGVDVYIYCKPAKPYDVVSKAQFIVGVDCGEIFTKPVKRAEGKGDGVIIYPKTSKFEIIKYK